MGEADGKRVVVFGATGNVGTSVLRALGDDPDIASVVGVARRVPDLTPPKTTWLRADVGREADLTRHVTGADAVIHLAWLFQPTHDPVTTWATNVLGSLRVFEAVARAGIPTLVYASSVGAYSPGPQDHAVDESYPTHGWPEAAYCREKAYLERALDGYEREHPEVRVVRMRPGFLFKRESATEQRRLFLGPFLPRRLVRPSMVPVVPDLPGLRFQALHTDDAADAYRRAVTRDVRGAFNLAADPPVDAEVLGRMLGARAVRMPPAALRAALAAAWRMHLVPASPGLFDAVLRLPLMDTGRAERELGWSPRFTAVQAIEEFVDGLRQGSGLPTAPLSPRFAGGRIGEVAGTGVGSRP